MKSVCIYTDGCCLKNPGGAGGYAFVVLDGSTIVKQSHKGFKASTNNRMEIMAAIAGIESLTEASTGFVFSDSQYLVHAIEQHWIEKWKGNGWRTRQGPVKNQDLWERLDALVKSHQLRFAWVRGHNGDIHNEYCDVMAGNAAKNPRHEDKGYTP